MELQPETLMPDWTPMSHENEGNEGIFISKSRIWLLGYKSSRSVRIGGCFKYGCLLFGYYQGHSPVTFHSKEMNLYICPKCVIR